VLDFIDLEGQKWAKFSIWCRSRDSIADMAAYPWVLPHERQRQDMSQFPFLASWFERIKSRPATQKAYEIAK